MALVNRLLLAFDGLRRRGHAPRIDAGRAQLMLDSIGDAVVSVDHEGRVTYMNRAAET